MKIAIVCEGSTKHRNADIMRTLEPFGHELFNLGMRNTDGEPDLTYIETALISALALNLGAVDFVVGGCGTGQGFMNAVLQFPGVACGLIMDPVEAFLYAKVNAGNCISLQLNKGYGGIGGDVNLSYIFEKIFADGYGGGYPAARAEIQVGARRRLERLSLDAHLPMDSILDAMDGDIKRRALTFPGIEDFIANAPDGALKSSLQRFYA